MSTGVNLRLTRGKQAVNFIATAKNPTATKYSNPEDATESTLPVTRRTPMKQVTSLETKLVNMLVIFKESLQSFQRSPP